MSFSDSSQNIIKRYIQSAVIVDDNFTWGDEGDFNEDIQAPGDFEGSVETNSSSAGAIEGEVDAKKIVKSFCRQGIVCSPYLFDKTDAEELPKIGFPSSVYKADLIILDWKLAQNDFGKTASNFLKELLMKDLEGDPKLRFVTIYSAETQREIITALVQELKFDEKINVINCSDHLDIEFNNHKIWRIHYVKKGQDGCLEDGLAEYVTELFGKFVSGYLPITVLASVSEVREKTPVYLARLHAGLDEAVISHYTTLRTQPSTFETSEFQFREYLVNLIGGMIANDLNNSKEINELVKSKPILDYLGGRVDLDLYSPGIEGVVKQRKNEHSNTNPSPNLVSTLSKDEYLPLLGVGKDKTFKREYKNRFKMEQKDNTLGQALYEGRLYSVLRGAAEDWQQGFLELSEIDLFEQTAKQGKRSHALKLGTVFFENNEDGHAEFYVCIQPLCDSVRLNKSNSIYPFPCLKIREVGSLGKEFDMVLGVSGEFRFLKVDYKPSCIEMLGFKSDKSFQYVRFSEDHILKDEGGREFHFGGQLKQVYAQEVVNLLATAGSRVGSDRFEWLRLTGSGR